MKNRLFIILAAAVMACGGHTYDVEVIPIQDNAYPRLSRHMAILPIMNSLSIPVRKFLRWEWIMVSFYMECISLHRIS